MFKIVFIMSPMDSSYKLKEAKKQIEEERKDIHIQFVDSFKMDTDPATAEAAMQQLEEAELVLILMHGGITHFQSFEAVICRFENKKKFFIHTGLEDENRLLLARTGISHGEYLEILRYILSANRENGVNLFKYLASRYGGVAVDYAPPMPMVWEGVYDPRQEDIDVASALENANSSGKPVIAILFYSKYKHEHDLAHIDALIAQVEKLGGYPLAVFSTSAPDPVMGCQGFRWVIREVLLKEGVCQVDAVINTLGYSQSIMANPGNGTAMVEHSIFEELNVPVIQAMATYQTYENWLDNLRGIDMMSFPICVYYPEFDGQIITVTYAYSEYIRDEIGERILRKPIPDRVDQICRLAMNWAKLRNKPIQDKKIAILFHNMPPRNDMIGCAFGLDTPQSVFLMIEALKTEGIRTSYDFADGDDIIGRIIAAVSNDTRWLSAEKALARSKSIITGETYRNWFAEFPATVKEQLVRDWGKPPGEYMVHEDQLPVPGIINGNLFIGLQPPRGYEEKADEVYHSTDIVPPHQYIAYYEWLRNDFQADAVVHVGTHGTLEWLPGKEIGLSQRCYPDVAIRDLPHLYPYSITVLGEGIQAKRRSNAVILDHLIPALMRSGTYDAMEALDDLVKQYYQAKQTDSGKVSIIRNAIIESVVKNDYHTDLNVNPEDINADFEPFLALLHNWLEEIKNTLIKDGLHILGKAPEHEKLVHMVCALLRLPNGKVVSLTEAACSACGYAYDDLKNNPHFTDHTGKTNLMRFDELEDISRDIIRCYLESGFDQEKSLQILSESELGPFERDLEPLKTVLAFILEVVLPKLQKTKEEIIYLLAGIHGRFVPPGGGGSPTRGNVNILPTGRNFYAIDPMSVPTRASWQVGKQLGDRLIERYLQDEEKYPETVVIVVYAGETMKTCGDDIAEILYLMGIQPKWLDSSDKVIGLEPIPSDELKRPRIDVTLRISGLFRDTFPNLVNLVEEAVTLAAGLDEKEEENYIRRNVMQEVTELTARGMSLEAAREEAGLRIFSDPPGTYGAGVEQLINSKNWKDVTDLGNNYTFWGGYAYGRKMHGKKVTEVFARRLSLAQVTVKNESSMEIDMLESDDFYNYHGGLIAAVRTHSGLKPKSYCGDSSDPSRVKLSDVREQSAKIMRSRILNPKWFDGLRAHGYKGAQEISGMVDFVFGWDATSDIIEDWMYEKICENYLFNEERKDWIASVNLWAVQNMVERLLEAQQRGMWKAKEVSLEKLRAIYMEIEGNIEDCT
ncbi:cobaltochelatase subunit CobN [Dehalobacter sp. DCM]|uniref:cobaltochelatase subunit CobN n=1 Tax=Dehalobacter sp. DCM TaxID=2907827 RepID=UPI003081C5D9|nr:cobaltochelatase subunit CobN [Dehalobacter sp. DCM]